jgi:hypothetical protein
METFIVNKNISNTCNNTYNICVNDIVNVKNPKSGNLVWYYTKNDEKEKNQKIPMNIEKKSKFTMNLFTVGETHFNSETSEYECKLHIEKLHKDFGIGMVTAKNCDFMGYANITYFAICENDNGYPKGYLEVDHNTSKFNLEVQILPEYKDLDLRIHIRYANR